MPHYLALAWPSIVETAVPLALTILTLALAAVFLWLHLVSKIEREFTAARRSLGAALVALGTGLVLAWVPFPFALEIGLVVLVVAIIAPVILLWPTGTSGTFSSVRPTAKLDERTIMFSRAELEKGTPRYDEYYRDHPQHQKTDEQFRKLPGLMNPAAGKYEALSFAAAAASFHTVDKLAAMIVAHPAGSPTDLDPAQLTAFVKGWALKLGARQVGITPMQDYHYYSVKGRGKTYGQPIEEQHKFGIAFTVEMDHQHMGTAPEGATLMESAQQYLNAGTIAVQIADFLAQIGHQAEAHIDGNYKVVCPLVGKDAGLGELGRMGLLMTPDLGPRVRLGVVTTNVSLIPDEPVFDEAILDFCSLCRKCADICPVGAIPQQGPQMVDGIERWQINSEDCYSYWCASGTDCGQCMKVCPYSHPDTLLHNLVRSGLGRSSIFRKFALRMDDLIYGRRPGVMPNPDWIPNRKA